MKTFKSLFYTGLMIVFIPLFLITVIVVLPAIVNLNKKFKKVEQEKHVVVYDTVKVEKIVYDTVRPKKKVVKKKEEISVEIKSDSIISY